MNVAVVSPLPPARTGVADYALTLTRELSRTMQIELVATLEKDKMASSDVVLYHMGNSALHSKVYDWALRKPGVVVLHDAVLHHFFLGQLNRDNYVSEFVYNYGEWTRQFADELWLNRAVSSCDARYFRYPMLRRIVERSRVIVVHNPGAARLVQEAVTGCNATPIVEIPHFAEEPHQLDDSSRGVIRKRLGIPPGTVVIGSFGYQRPTKRLRSLLRALRDIERPYRLLMIGEFVSSSYRQALEPLLDGVPAIRRPYVSEREFLDLVEITDICVNLRSPSAGETSAITVKLAAAAKPVIMSAGAESSRYPEDSFWRVDPGETELETLRAMLRVLVENRPLRVTMGLRARDYVLAHHALPHTAKLYSNALARSAV